MTAKRMRASVLLLAAAQLVIAADEMPAAKPELKEDPRVAAELKALNFEYTVTDDKDFKLVFEVGDEKRTQAIVVNSNTEVYDKAALREVWSVAHVVNDPIDQALANRLLRANNTVKMGAWRAWPGDKKGDTQEMYIVFAAQIDADASKDVLSATLDMVAQTADELENELTQKDDH